MVNYPNIFCFFHPPAWATDFRVKVKVRRALIRGSPMLLNTFFHHLIIAMKLNALWKRKLNLWIIFPQRLLVEIITKKTPKWNARSKRKLKLIEDYVPTTVVGGNNHKKKPKLNVYCNRKLNLWIIFHLFLSVAKITKKIRNEMLDPKETLS